MLLEAAGRERPSDAQRMRVREAIWEAAPPASGRVAATSSGVATKVAIVGAMGLALVGLVLLQRGRPTPVEPIDREASMVHLSHVDDLQTATAVLTIQPTATPDQAVAPAPKTRAASENVRAPTRTASASNDASDVRDQIRMLDEARASMDRHNPTAALAEVDRYAAKYPEGMFRQEARILRILALDDRGDHARATSLARAFVASYPTSAHVARIERIASR
jgi:hypothetical protein